METVGGGREIMSRKKIYTTKEEKKAACAAAFKAKHGLSYGGYHYRLKNNLPLDAPILHGRRPNPNPKEPTLYKSKRSAGPVRKGKPADCRIVPGEGRPLECFRCPDLFYLGCLSFASDRNWRGWRIKT